MAGWVVLALAGIVAAAFAVKRLLFSSSPRRIDAGDVSQSWLNEQQATKEQDRFFS